MTYTYGTHGAPSVGGGLPGLPQRIPSVGDSFIKKPKNGNFVCRLPAFTLVTVGGAPIFIYGDEIRVIMLASNRYLMLRFDLFGRYLGAWNVPNGPISGGSAVLSADGEHIWFGRVSSTGTIDSGTIFKLDGTEVHKTPQIVSASNFALSPLGYWLEESYASDSMRKWTIRNAATWQSTNARGFGLPTGNATSVRSKLKLASDGSLYEINPQLYTGTNAQALTFRVLNPAATGEITTASVGFLAPSAMVLSDVENVLHKKPDGAYFIAFKEAGTNARNLYYTIITNTAAPAGSIRQVIDLTPLGLTNNAYVADCEIVGDTARILISGGLGFAVLELDIANVSSSRIISCKKYTGTHQFSSTYGFLRGDRIIGISGTNPATLIGVDLSQLPDGAEVSDVALTSATTTAFSLAAGQNTSATTGYNNTPPVLGDVILTNAEDLETTSVKGLGVSGVARAVILTEPIQ